ncbi:MAG: hypothetical protein ACI8P2_003784 [Candidatus Latescibacterota bacterium]|jgi:hypothetical protein
MWAESLLKNRVLEEVNSKKWVARCKRNEPWNMCLVRGCARSVGRGDSALWLPAHPSLASAGGLVDSSQTGPAYPA